MNRDKKRNLLFIQDERSEFDAETKMFNALFNRVDKVSGKEEALKLFDANDYDIVLCDLSVEPEGAGLLKQMKDMKTEQTIFALVSPKDTDKLYGIADLGINAFELTPEYFDQALEQIAIFDPQRNS
ncbi:response regulator [Sulfurovum sp. AR]|uniref:response regulator n=1 Tax=Sulfurovum sp. AR TaxID=1165841 RepID=UPI00025C4D27|nr:response regulator [Sulfurovum sp. AR]EIF52050.1 response regulator receiver modulated metal dependent phosphohydrolase [Sulfurovum sp. AR]